MRLDTASSKKDRYSLEQTSAHALMENYAPELRKKVLLSLDIAGVVRDFEKVRFSQNSQYFGDRKCLPEARTSLVGLPNAKFFWALFWR